jgi:hypothetical protein
MFNFDSNFLYLIKLYEVIFFNAFLVFENSFNKNKFYLCIFSFFQPFLRIFHNTNGYKRYFFDKKYMQINLYLS